MGAANDDQWKFVEEDNANIQKNGPNNGGGGGGMFAFDNDDEGQQRMRRKANMADGGDNFNL